MTAAHGLLIGGEERDSADDSITLVNPATEESDASVAAASSADVDDAVDDALDASDEWGAVEPAERGRIVAALAAEIRSNRDRLARLETADTGKPLGQAAADVEWCARAFEYYAGAADKIHGESIPLSEEYVDYTIREPLGVTAQILPWNYPIGMLGRSVAPALAAGNAAIVKPGDQTPRSALAVGHLAIDAGVPPGVLNVVPGRGAEAGATLAGHPALGGVSFTGSVPTGREVGKAAIENITEVHLELGGKNPLVAFADADPTDVAENAVAGLFEANAGQICSGAARLLVHEDAHEAVVDELRAKTDELTLGPGMDDPDVGPLTTRQQYETVIDYIQVGVETVGEPVTGGIPERDGYFVEPTIFDDVPQDSRLSQEEIFGPVLAVTTFASETEAVALANDVPYGLVAGVFTDDVGRAHRFARDVDAGQVFVNEWFAGGIETPFGGYKESGVGREKGLAALDSYTQLKNVCLNVSGRD
jgi:aldehyde dehydrogenase (NAD+)